MRENSSEKRELNYTKDSNASDLSRSTKAQDASSNASDLSRLLYQQESQLVGFREANRNFRLTRTEALDFLGIGVIGSIPMRKVLCVNANRLKHHVAQGIFNPRFWYKA